eukprot:2079044-Rhodomonas_salina.3
MAAPIYSTFFLVRFRAVRDVCQLRACPSSYLLGSSLNSPTDLSPHLLSSLLPYPLSPRTSSRTPDVSHVQMVSALPVAFCAVTGLALEPDLTCSFVQGSISSFDAGFAPARYIFKLWETRLKCVRRNISHVSTCVGHHVRARVLALLRPSTELANETVTWYVLAVSVGARAAPSGSC